MKGFADQMGHTPSTYLVRLLSLSYYLLSYRPATRCAVREEKRVYNSSVYTLYRNCSRIHSHICTRLQLADLHTATLSFSGGEDDVSSVFLTNVSM
jgi:hypothetical protein